MPTNPRPSAGAMRATRAIQDEIANRITAHRRPLEIIERAQIIDRESGLGELAEAARKVSSAFERGVYNGNAVERMGYSPVAELRAALVYVKGDRD